MLICTKGGTVFFILTHLGHKRTQGHGRRKGTTGARDVYERCTRGAVMWALKWKRVFFILTHLGHWRQSCTRGAREGHERGTKGAGNEHR